MSAITLEANTTYSGELVSRDKVDTYDVYGSRCPNVTGVIAIVKVDEVQVGIKGFAWDVPELALLPLGSKVSFQLNEDGVVSSMEPA
jgi:hypothetical protein